MARFNLFLVTILSTVVTNSFTATLRNEPNSGIIQLCGFRSAGDQSLGFNRIVGGVDAEKNEFKWQVSIRLRYEKKLHHICGGTVIGESWVLTAAHCTADFSKDELVFVAGDHLIKTREGSEQHRRADLFLPHEDYNAVSQENDIALVRLSKPFNFSTFFVAPACLPDHQQSFSGNCVVTGWGKRREGGKNSNVLQKVWLPVISDDLCRSRMTKIGYGKLITDSMICAGYEAGGKDACQGDSGGPMVCPGHGEMPILTGIVSWGIGCARKNMPGIYTEVSYFVNWITKKIKENSPVSTNRGPFADNTKIGDLNIQEQPNDRIKGLNPFVHIPGGFDVVPIPPEGVSELAESSGGKSPQQQGIIWPGSGRPFMQIPFAFGPPSKISDGVHNIYIIQRQTSDESFEDVSSEEEF